MVASNGRYYLLCLYDKHKDEITPLRMDRIINAKILNERLEKCKAFENFNLQKHMKEHIHMMSGESENVRFEFNCKILKDVIDWFGSDITLKKGSSENVIIAETKVNENAIRFWAMQYGENVTVKAPKRVVDSIKKQLKDMSKRYSK